MRDVAQANESEGGGSTAFHSVIVVGASAGGVAALRSIAAALPSPLAAPILVVLHIGAQRSDLPALLNAVGGTPAKHGEDGESIRPGQIYIAPPDRHMIVVEDRLRLTRGPKENWARPAIDPLFRSAAETFGPAAIGVILTGNLNDGTAGLYEIKRRGGLAVAQDPDDAAHPEMPRSAAAHVDLDYCTPLAEIPELLKGLVAEREGVMAIGQTRKDSERGSKVVDGGVLDRPLTITCPDCGGALRRSRLGTIQNYACHIGHTYTAEAMAAAQFDHMERVMRSAERILNERAEFCRQMAERAVDPSGEGPGAAVWRSAGLEAAIRAYALRDFVEQDWISPYATASPQ